jgi:hypothetical protein
LPGEVSVLDFKNFMKVFRTKNVKFVRVSIADMSLSEIDMSTDIDTSMVEEAKDEEAKPLTVKDYMLRAHKNERRLEDTLRRLGNSCDFTIPNAMQIFDPSMSGGVDQSAFKETCEAYGVDVDPEAVYLVIERYDADGDGKLDLPEFREMLSPRASSTRRLLDARPHFNLSGTRTSQFCLKTKLLFKQAMELLMENETLDKKHKSQVKNWDALEQQF